MRAAAIALVLLATLLPAAAAAAQSTITCTASVTADLSTTPTLRDLKPSILPVLGFRALPAAGEFKHVARLGGTAVGLYVYRVDEDTAHMRLFEYADEPGELLADTPLGGEMTEMTYRIPGGEEMITAYCYW